MTGHLCRGAAFLLMAMPFVLSAQAAGSAASGAAPEAQPGDRIVLKIWNEPEMSDTFTISQHGEVTLPRLGPQSVRGIEIYELEDSLRTAFTSFLRNPSVEVEVLRRISVLGAVQEPGIYLVDLTMNIPDVVARAGGPTDTGDRNRITLQRGSERFEFSGGSQQEMMAMPLYSGDQIIVGQRNFIARNPWAAVSTAFGLVTLLLQLGII
ncbi:MAG: polysaccharide biosynthesis/export family protein [Gemmatimonadota bacterium]